MRAQRPIVPAASALLAAAALAGACRSTPEDPPPAAETRPGGETSVPGYTGGGDVPIGDSIWRDTQPVDFEVADSGTQLAIEAPMARIFRSQVGWREAWSDSPATQVGEKPPTPRVEQVDWSHQMLAVIAIGQRQSAGYGVEILGIERSGGFMRIRARLTEPPPDSMQAQVVTHPYVVLRLPRFEGPVVFEIE